MRRFPLLEEFIKFCRNAFKINILEYYKKKKNNYLGVFESSTIFVNFTAEYREPRINRAFALEEKDAKANLHSFPSTSRAVLCTTLMIIPRAEG